MFFQLCIFEIFIKDFALSLPCRFKHQRIDLEEIRSIIYIYNIVQIESNIAFKRFDERKWEKKIRTSYEYY